MKMIVIKALLLFLLYDSTFAQPDSPECMAALEAFNSTDAECQQAYEQVANAANMTDSTDPTTRLTLEAYCSSSCRPIVENITSECVSGSVSSLVNQPFFLGVALIDWRL